MTEAYFKHGETVYGPYAKGTFYFTPPQDGSIALLKGFEVMQYKSSQTLPTCHIFDLSEANWQDGIQDFETLFSLVLFPMAPGLEYALSLYTLPKLPPKYEKYKDLQLTVRTSNVAQGKEARFWAASISYHLNPTEREVLVSFTKPLEKHGFKEYEVTLKNLIAGQRQSVFITEYQHTFTEVVSGIYEIWVLPLKERGGCSCREGELECHVCSTTRTANFTFEYDLTTTESSLSTSLSSSLDPSMPISSSSDNAGPVPGEPVTQSTSTKDSEESSTKRSTSDDESVTGVQIAMAVVGSLLGIGLVVVMLLIYYYCRRRSAGDENDNYKANEIDDDLDSTVTAEVIKKGLPINNHPAEKIILERRPKLFVLYEEDHPHHKKVVDNFMRYLTDYCNCTVMSGQLHLDTTWVHEETQDADYVIIVNSELAYGVYKSLLGKIQGQTENTSSGNLQVPGINCIMQRFLQEPRYDKIVMVYFDYTDEKYIIPDICPGYHYRLMKNFTDFLLHIHKLKRTDNLTRYDLPLDGKYYLKPAGKDLQTEIKKAAAYQRQNPNWFIQTYGYMRSFSNASDESGIDSGLPPEPIFLDPVSRHLQEHFDSDSQDAITVTPPVFIEYGGKTYRTLSPHSFQPHIYNSNKQAKTARESSPTTEFGGAGNYITSAETPVTADSGGQFDFIPPDDQSEFETASKSQSEQMMSINARNFGAEFAEYDNKAYNWKQDLTLLRVQSGEIPYESQSLGGESV